MLIVQPAVSGRAGASCSLSYFEVRGRESRTVMGCELWKMQLGAVVSSHKWARARFEERYQSMEPLR